MDSLFIDILVVGLSVGLIYALVALGFSLVFGTAKIFFLTHGEIYMLGSMLTFYFTQRVGMSYLPSLILIVFITGSLGLLIQRLLRPLRGQGLATLLVTLMLAMLIANISLNIFGEQTRAVSHGLWSSTLYVLGVPLAGDRVVVILCCILVDLSLYAFIKLTWTGQAIRAIAQDEEAAALQGISTDRCMSLTFFLACSTAGLAGVLVAPIYYVDVFLGTPALMRAFMVVVLGGLGSLSGAIAGGLLLGFLESLSYGYIGSNAQLVSFVAVILMLIIRPEGLLGRK
jgi:branched-chain amino acid transport system permease protein